MNKIIAYTWRTAHDTVGIVAVRIYGDGKSKDYWRAYIGVAKRKDEDTEIRDAKFIADYGARLSKAEAVPFFPKLNPDKYYEK